MQVTSLSKSGIESYDDCPFKYYLQYMCRIPSPAGKAAAMGTCFHKIMELMAQCHQRGRVCRITTDLPWITRICFNRCIKDNPEFSFNEEDYEISLKWVNIIVGSIRSPLKHKKILGVEQKFRYEFQKPGMEYRYGDKSGHLAVNGVIDLVVELDEDTIEIIDYKTGKHIKDWNTGKIKTIDDFQKDMQLRLYNLVAKQMYPEYKNRLLTLVYIQARKTFSVSMDLNDEINTVDVLRRHFRKISMENSPMRIKDDPLRSKERFKCRKVCYYGITEISPGVSMCDAAHKLCKEHGYTTAATLVPITCSVVKAGAKASARKSFVDASTKTGVIT